MRERQLFKARNGEDYQPQAVSQWRLRELLQFEKDAAELRARVAALEAETQQLKQVIANEAAVYQKVFTERARLEAENQPLTAEKDRPSWGEWWDAFELLWWGKIGNTWETGRLSALKVLLERYPSQRVARLEAENAQLRQRINELEDFADQA